MKFAILTNLLKELKFSIIQNSLSKIKLAVFDVDGVLTDGNFWIDKLGNQFKRFNVKDGLGIKLLQSVGITVAFVSGGKGGATNARADDLGINYCFTGVKDKSKVIKDLQKKLKIYRSETLFIGDDLNDLPVISNVAIFLAPNDASYIVKKTADAVLLKNGGNGAIREFAERILKAKRRWSFFKKNGWLENND